MRTSKHAGLSVWAAEDMSRGACFVLQQYGYKYRTVFDGAQGMRRSTAKKKHISRVQFAIDSIGVENHSTLQTLHRNLAGSLMPTNCSSGRKYKPEHF
jgi:hypothetical protein